MLNNDAFIEKYYYDANKQKLDCVKRFLKHISELAGDSPIEDKLRDKDFLCKAFYLQKLNAITRTHYQKIKEYLVDLFDWFQIEGSVPTQTEVIESSKVKTYFRDLESAMKFIDRVGELVLKKYQPEQDLVIVKSIFILGWYGLVLKDLVDLKKEFVSDDGVVSVNDKKIVVDKSSAYILNKLKKLVYYSSLPNGVVKYLKGDEQYMFRATSGQDKMQETYIAQILNRFNKNTPNYLQQNITFRSIYPNAKFVEIFNDKTEKPLLEKITHYTGCSTKQAYSYRTQYLAWLEQINQNKI